MPGGPLSRAALNNDGSSLRLKPVEGLALTFSSLRPWCLYQSRNQTVNFCTHDLSPCCPIRLLTVWGLYLSAPKYNIRLLWRESLIYSDKDIHISAGSSVASFGVVGVSFSIFGGVDKLILALSTSAILVIFTGFDFTGDGGGNCCDDGVEAFLGVTSSPGSVAIIWRRSSSDIILTFNDRAFSDFDSPPSRPRMRYVVLLLIDPVTRPPYFSIKPLHSSRSNDSSIPKICQD